MEQAIRAHIRSVLIKEAVAGVIKALATAIPFVGALFNIPVIGNILTSLLTKVVTITIETLELFFSFKAIDILVNSQRNEFNASLAALKDTLTLPVEDPEREERLKEANEKLKNDFRRLASLNK